MNARLCPHATRRIFFLLFCLTSGVRAAVVGGTLQFSTSSYSVPESQSNALLTVTRAGDTNGVASVNWSVIGGSATAGADYSHPAARSTLRRGRFFAPSA